MQQKFFIVSPSSQLILKSQKRAQFILIKNFNSVSGRKSVAVLKFTFVGFTSKHR